MFSDVLQNHSLICQSHSLSSMKTGDSFRTYAFSLGRASGKRPTLSRQTAGSRLRLGRARGEQSGSRGHSPSSRTLVSPDSVQPGTGLGHKPPPAPRARQDLRPLCLHTEFSYFQLKTFCCGSFAKENSEGGGGRPAGSAEAAAARGLFYSSRCRTGFIGGRQSPPGPRGRRPPAPSAPGRLHLLRKCRSPQTGARGPRRPAPSGGTPHAARPPLPGACETTQGVGRATRPNPADSPPRRLAHRDSISGGAVPRPPRSRPESIAHARRWNGRQWRSHACAGSQRDMRRATPRRPAEGNCGRPRLP